MDIKLPRVLLPHLLLTFLTLLLNMPASLDCSWKNKPAISERSRVSELFSYLTLTWRLNNLQQVVCLDRKGLAAILNIRMSCSDPF